MDVVSAGNLRESVAERVRLEAQAFGEDWPLIWATRNRIAHGYTTIDLSIIKATVRDDLPAFRSSIAQALEQS